MAVSELDRRARRQAFLRGTLASIVAALLLSPFFFYVLIDTLGRALGDEPNNEWWAPLFYLSPLAMLLIVVLVGITVGRRAYRKARR